MQESTTLDQRSDLDVNQKVVLYPSFAFRKKDSKCWQALIAGFAYQEGQDSMRQRLFLRLLMQVLQVDEAKLKSNEVFQERIRGFLADPQRAKTIVVRLADEQLIPLRRSRRNGHFRGHTLLNKEVNGRFSDTGTGLIDCNVLLNENDGRQFSGRIQPVPRRGTSVISDVDDTVKISQVAYRRQLLHNTFLNPFVAVPGMAELYQQWEEAGSAFHYVSSSPWQLYEPLSRLLKHNHFPEGSFHLRTIRFSDPSVLRLFMSRKRNKYQVIKTIFRLFPQRRFVLVGDSGEKDPEIYGAIARKFPTQLQRILIRRVEGNKWTRKRVSRAFRSLPRDLWQTFRVPSQVKPLDMQT